MDKFDYDDQPRPRFRIFDILFNLLTLVILLVVLSVVGAFLFLFLNPYSSLNPFPPPTPIMIVGPPTLTPTPRGFLPPTWTPTATQIPTDPAPPRPTATLPPTSTPFSVFTLTPPPPTPTDTVPPAGYPFAVQKGTPINTANIAHPELGCNWTGVAGQVLDMSGGPKTQVIVVLGGTLGGKQVNSTGALYSLTGVATQYGRAGFEFTLGDKPIASKNTLWVQLIDQQGVPISDRAYLQTSASCDKNLTLINFRQVR
jgi:hypothetical protein